MSPDEYAERKLDLEREMQRDLTLLDDLRDAEAAIERVRAALAEIDCDDPGIPYVVERIRGALGEAP